MEEKYKYSKGYNYAVTRRYPSSLIDAKAWPIFYGSRRVLYSCPVNNRKGIAYYSHLPVNGLRIGVGHTRNNHRITDAGCHRGHFLVHDGRHQFTHFYIDDGKLREFHFHKRNHMEWHGKEIDAMSMTTRIPCTHPSIVFYPRFRSLLTPVSVCDVFDSDKSWRHLSDSRCRPAAHRWEAYDSYHLQQRISSIYKINQNISQHQHDRNNINIRNSQNKHLHCKQDVNDNICILMAI